MSLPVHRIQRTPARWDPFRDIEDFYDRIGRLLESTSREAGSAVPIPWLPPVDLEETEDAYTVEADLPGVAREDVSIEVNERELLVTGEIKERKRLGRLHRRARPTGRFEYRLGLPGEVDASGAEATLSGGVLSIRLPKTHDAKPKRIEITEGSGASS
jgi:HSP20 family protein